MSDEKGVRSSSFLSFAQIEIENLKEESSHEPGSEVDRGDKLICHIGHYRAIKNTYGIAIEKERLRDETLLKARYAKEEERELLEREALKYAAEHSFFMALFWMEIKKRVEESHPDVWVKGIGIRKGWKVVYTNQTDLLSLDFLRRIIGD